MCTHLSNQIFPNQSSLGNADPGKVSRIVEMMSHTMPGRKEMIRFKGSILGKIRKLGLVGGWRLEVGGWAKLQRLLAPSSRHCEAAFGPVRSISSAAKAISCKRFYNPLLLLVFALVAAMLLAYCNPGVTTMLLCSNVPEKSRKSLV